MLPGVAVEMLERPLVGLEELRLRLGEAGLIVAAPAEAEGEHEDVPHGARVAERDPGLPPIDLSLLAERGPERNEHLWLLGAQTRNRRTLDSAPAKPYSATRRS